MLPSWGLSLPLQPSLPWGWMWPLAVCGHMWCVPKTRRGRCTGWTEPGALDGAGAGLPLSSWTVIWARNQLSLRWIMMSPLIQPPSVWANARRGISGSLPSGRAFRAALVIFTENMDGPTKEGTGAALPQPLCPGSFSLLSWGFQALSSRMLSAALGSLHRLFHLLGTLSPTFPPPPQAFSSYALNHCLNAPSSELPLWVSVSLF